MITRSGMRAPELRLIALPGIPFVSEGDDLAALILQSLANCGETLRSGDALVIAQKIVSKAEGRAHRLGAVIPSSQAVMLAQETGKDARLIEFIIGEATAVPGADVGVVVNDSHGRAWRNGMAGVAIGVAALPAVVDLRGVNDLYQRKLRSTEIALADELASAASLLMGQAAEGLPVVLARGVPYPRREGNARELIRTRERDFFR
jgi:coenzyme F420-0:L-glutamate ligase/coenzyme F420-1:gamma-L-glutamate ligase